MYILYYSPGAASMVVHLALLEIGAPYELRKMDLDAGQHKSTDYLKLNPNGVVPTLIVDGKPYYECAALLLLLAERHPDAKLAPAPGSEQRALYLQWILHFSNTIQAAFNIWFHPGQYGAVEREAEIKGIASKRIEAAWGRFEAHLTAYGPHMLGEKFSITDIYAVMLMRWSRNMPKPATEWPALRKLATIVKARPSWKRVYELEGLTEWA